MSDVVLDRKELDKMLANLPKGAIAFILHDGVEYGVFQEFGTDTVPAHPFMTPALDAVKPEYDAAMKQVAEGNLEAVLNKIANDALGVAIDNVPVDTGNLKNSLRVDRSTEL